MPAPELTLSLSPRARIPLPVSQTLHVCLVGVGGTGSALALALSRLAWHCEQKGVMVDLTFVDPDTVEPVNIGRQFFAPAEVGQNKACTMARRMSAALGLAIHALPIPFESDLLYETWKLHHRSRGQHLVVGAVDNHLARREIARAVTRARGGLWWLDCGNDHYSGRIYLGNLSDLRDIASLRRDDFGFASGLPAPHRQDPALLEPEARDLPTDSCAVLTEREEQSLLVNQAIAAHAAQYCADFLLRRSLSCYRTAFTLDPPTARSRLITEEALAELAAQARSTLEEEERLRPLS